MVEILSVEDVLRDEREALGLDPDRPGPTAALCISGGGIRSATFGLGAIQGLARAGLLQQFDYMSTVSGGGYIGGWLTAWIKRVGSLEQVLPHLQANTLRPDPGEPDPIQHLRDYNHYLSPRMGALSGDFWSVIATVVRNIALNWMVILPLFTALLLAPRIFLAFLAYPGEVFGGLDFLFFIPGKDHACRRYDDPALNAISNYWAVKYLLSSGSVFLLALSMLNTLRFMPSAGNHQEYDETDYILWILAPIVGAALAFLMHDSLYYVGVNYRNDNTLWVAFVWAGVPFIVALVIFVAAAPKRRWRLLIGPLPGGIAAMALGMGATTWLVMNDVLWDQDCARAASWATYVTLGLPLILLGYCLGTTLFVGLSSHFTSDEDREWMSRSVAGVMMFGAAWFCVCGSVLYLPSKLLGWNEWAPGLVAAAGGLSAWLSSFGSAGTANVNPGAALNQQNRWLSLAVKFAPLAFIVMLTVGLSIATNAIVALLTPANPARGVAVTLSWTDHDELLQHANPLVLGALAIALIGMSWIMARFVNVNIFSLNGMYRDRLVRAYLGASNVGRKANRFTGFCPSDNVKMSEIDPCLRPFHVSI